MMKKWRPCGAGLLIHHSHDDGVFCGPRSDALRQARTGALSCVLPGALQCVVACSCTRWPAMTIAHNFGCTGTLFPEHYSHDDGVLCGTVTCLVVAFSVFIFSLTMPDRRGFSPEPRSLGACWSRFLAERLAQLGMSVLKNIVIQGSFLLL